MTFVKFKETYNVKTNFLCYQSVIYAIKSYLKSFNLSSNGIQIWTASCYQNFTNQKNAKKICIMYWITKYQTEMIRELVKNVFWKIIIGIIEMCIIWQKTHYKKK